jgi:hypothetical protein
MPTGDLHGYAVDAEKNLEALATGLAQAGHDPGTIDAVTQMADMTRQLVKALGAGQEQTGDDQPATMDSATNDLHAATVAAAQAKR